MKLLNLRPLNIFSLLRPHAKLVNAIAIVTLLLGSGIVSAANQVKQSAPNYAEFEVPRLSMKLSNDGTGIISNVSCGGCDYRLVKITKNTNAYVNGVKVDLFRARERAGKPVFIQFVRSSGEVMAIRWME